VRPLNAIVAAWLRQLLVLMLSMHSREIYICQKDEDIIDAEPFPDEQPRVQAQSNEYGRKG